MRWLFVLLLAIPSVSGCAHEGGVLRPHGAERREPQYHNRMLINPNTDLFGV
jgi:hypothetical protein